MADNVTIKDAADATQTVASDDIAGVQYQRVKLSLGADGVAVDAPGEGTYGVDVDVTRLPALAAGTNNIGDVDVLSLPAATVAGSSSLPAGTNNIGDVDVLTLPGTASEAAALPSVFVVVAGDDGTDTQPLQLSAAGDLKVTLDSETVALAAGTNNIGDVDVLSIAAGDNNIGNVDIVTVPAPLSTTGNGTAAAALRVTVASDSSGQIAITGSVDTELPAAAALADAAANPTTPTAGSANLMYNGTTWDRVRGDTTNGLDVDVTRLPALVAGTANIGDVDVLTVPAPLSTTGNGTAATALRVTVASDSSGQIAVTGAVDTELPAAAALADAAANPTTPTAGAANLVYNGTTWDRVRGDTTNGIDVDVTRVSGNVTVIQGTATNLKVDASGVAVPVTDNAGSLTVDAPVGTPVFARLSDGSAALVGQKAMTASLPVVIASDQSALTVSSHAVTNAGTFAVQDSEKVADNAAFTDGTTKVLPSGFIFDEVAGTALTENDAAAGRIDSKRAQVLVIEDETTRGRRVTVTASNALKVDNSAVTQPVSGTVTADTELPTAAALADATANPTVPLVGSAGEVFNGTTWDRVRSVVNGQNTTGTGIPAAGILGQFDDTSPGAVTENQFAPVRISSRRAILVEGVASGTGVNVVTELPSAAALADGAANATTPTVGAANLVYNGTTWDRVRGDTTNGMDVDVTRVVGAGTLASGQTLISNTAATIVAARTGRRRVTIVNRQTVVVYIGIATVTNANSLQLDPGDSITLETSALVQGLAAASYAGASPARVQYIEEY